MLHEGRDMRRQARVDMPLARLVRIVSIIRKRADVGLRSRVLEHRFEKLR